jgi:hypothetical protein
MSFRDIGVILNKTVEEKKKEGQDTTMEKQGQDEQQLSLSFVLGCCICLVRKYQ